MSTREALAALVAFASMQLACGVEPERGTVPSPEAEPSGGQTLDFNPLRNAYFGDLHVHTRFSFDAFIFNVRTNPDDAYRYARGEPLLHPVGYPIRLRGAPLDFMAVTDHAFYLGVINAMGDPDHPLSQTELAAELISSDLQQVATAFRTVTESWLSGEADPRLHHPDITRDTWQEEIAAAERHYRPGVFTTFVGYEYTSHPGYNLHRNVIFRSADVPEAPFGTLDSQNPEELWRWLDAQRAQGIEALAIPHNPNWSNGNMFPRTQWSGEPLDADYAALRMRNEPIVEMTQVKGTSETHPMLSPNDEWSDFEIWRGSAGGPLGDTTQQVSGGYVRDAYLTGLALEGSEGFNPYRFGLIGSSDTHNAGAPYEESSYYSKVGVSDGTPERRGSVPAGGASTWDAPSADAPAAALGVQFGAWGASGLAGVWAEENTREAIFDALRRKETFATSGTRIRVRFFGGFDYDEGLLDGVDAVAKAYENGIPMGGDLIAQRERAPRFLAWALRDPQSAWLQRLQIVKGWVENGTPRERVFDVACSDGGVPDPATHRCPDNGAGVDLSDCSYSVDKGAAELRALWSDPSFDPAQRAFYYARVLENLTCRWSTWDAIRSGVPPNPTLQPTIQERAWSSPIWYVPQGS